MRTFDESGLSKALLKATQALGFEGPTEVQEQAIPLLLEDERDLIGLAQTGTGKTAAFGLPLLHHIDPSVPSTQALILAPTRELCQQTASQLKAFNEFQEGIGLLSVYGGTSISQQLKALRSPRHILIATPGRLIDLIGRGAVDLGQLRYLVLDEADEMLNMGFKKELDRILSHTPAQKRTWSFSATMPPEIRRILSKYMDAPQELHINRNEEVNADIEHRYALVGRSDKADALMRFMDSDPDMRALVFCRTRRETRNLAGALRKRQYRVDALNGDLSQGQRDKVMNRFRSNKMQALIATDVAARGIDVDDLSHVFQFDLPDDLPYYTHRSGRTARGGRKGASIVLMEGRDRGKLKRIEKKLGIRFDTIQVPGQPKNGEGAHHPPKGKKKRPRIQQ